VAVEVLRHGPLPRAELARRLGLSAGSLTRLARPLLDAGLLDEGSTEVHLRTGRPALPLDVRPSPLRLVGVKITGDELFAVVTDLRAGVLATRTGPLPGRAPAAVVAAVAAVVDTLRSEHPGVAGLGIGVGGLVVARRQVAVAHFLGWDDVPLAALAEAATGLPVVVENDVRALTAAEHWFGAGRGLHSFALLTIGAGVGAGIVVHDRLVEGAHGAGGGVGHHRLGGGGVCARGHRGCAHGVLSSTAIAARIGAVHGRRIGYAQALDLARDGDPAARAVVAEAGRALGRLVADLAVLDPELVILSGEGVDLVELVRPELDAALAEPREPGAGAPRLVVRPFPFTDWARGAAAVAVQELVRDRAAR
jgi:predicted NBD/HSP70 family sugar kinase